MKSSKVLVIKELYFNLPEDFNGTVTDALELLLAYRKEKSKDIKRINENNLLNLLNDKDKKCYCSEGIYDFNKIINNI